jgi:hypothetical protein
MIEPRFSEKLQSAGEHFRKLAERMEGLHREALSLEEEKDSLHGRIGILAQDNDELKLKADQLEDLCRDLGDCKRELKLIEEVYAQWGI